MLRTRLLRVALVASITAASTALLAEGETQAPAAVTPAPAETPTDVAATPTPVTIDAREVAVSFLREIEEKNKNVATLYGEFDQVRVNPMFLEEIHSRGAFWYERPNKFRCDYFEPTPVTFYLLGNEVVTYTPELKQVEKYRIESADDAPINQMLVGFGVQAEKILEVFNVRLAPVQPNDPGQLSIEFASRDIDRSLGFSRITVTFDRALKEPRELFLEEDQDTVTVKLGKVEQNAKIEASQFEFAWPEDVEVIEHR